MLCLDSMMGPLLCRAQAQRIREYEKKKILLIILIIFCCFYRLHITLSPSYALSFFYHFFLFDSWREARLCFFLFLCAAPAIVTAK